MVSINPEAPFEGERPDNFIVGVINDEKEAESAVGDLQASGYSNDSVNVLHGEKGVEAMHHRGERPGTSGRLQRLRNLLEEFAAGGMDDIRRHEEAARQGNYVVGVTLPSDDDEPREEVKRILKSHGGYDIILVKGSTVEVLER